MNFLKKLGLVALKIVGIASGLLPMISPALASAGTEVRAYTDKLTSAFHAVITAEQMFAAANGPDAKTGSQKLSAASPFVGALVQDVLKELTQKAQPKDEAKLEAAIKQITSGLADALNAYGE